MILYSCNDYAILPLIKILKNILLVIQILAPILLIVSASMIILKSIGSDMNDEKKSKKKIFNAFIACIIIFLIPTIVNITLDAVGNGIGGLNFSVANCWAAAENYNIKATPRYIKKTNKDNGKEPTKVYIDPEDYPKGSTGVNPNKQGLNGNYQQQLVQVARSQIGVGYHTMHYGPKGSGDEGFGCAMFVSYCYNQVFFGGKSGQDRNEGAFYGSTYEYWGNVTRDGYNPWNKTFVEVSYSEAQAGDVMAFVNCSDPYSSYSCCYHVGLYIGDGHYIDSSGSGTSGVGVSEHDSVPSSGVHYLRYTGVS